MAHEFQSRLLSCAILLGRGGSALLRAGKVPGKCRSGAWQTWVGSTIPAMIACNLSRNLRMDRLRFHLKRSALEMKEVPSGNRFCTSSSCASPSSATVFPTPAIPTFLHADFVALAAAVTSLDESPERTDTLRIPSGVAGVPSETFTSKSRSTVHVRAGAIVGEQYAFLVVLSRARFSNLSRTASWSCSIFSALPSAKVKCSSRFEAFSMFIFFSTAIVALLNTVARTVRQALTLSLSITLVPLAAEVLERDCFMDQFESSRMSRTVAKVSSKTTAMSTGTASGNVKGDSPLQLCALSIDRLCRSTIECCGSATMIFDVVLYPGHKRARFYDDSKPKPGGLHYCEVSLAIFVAE